MQTTTDYATALGAAREARQSLMQPLREQAATLDQLIANTEKTLAELRVERQSVGRALQYLDPAAPTARRKYDASRLREATRNAFQANRERVLEHVNAMAEPFTAADIHAWINQDRANGSKVGRQMVLRVLRSLHADGLIAIDGKIVGGGDRYRRIGAADG